MKTKKALAGVALGLGLGAVVAPTAALAQPTPSPGVTQQGTISSTQVIVTPQEVSPGGTISIQSPCQGTAQISGPNINTTVNVIQQQAGIAPLAIADFDIDQDVQGIYFVNIVCQDGKKINGGKFHVHPKGHPRGGDGGKVDNGYVLAAGAGLLGVATAGFALMRRRAKATV